MTVTASAKSSGGRVSPEGIARPLGGPEPDLHAGTNENAKRTAMSVRSLVTGGVYTAPLGFTP